ncbi:MAG: hypothetical protein R2827_02705 [Bdellovibrionales bacterium]
MTKLVILMFASLLSINGYAVEIENILVPTAEECAEMNASVQNFYKNLNDSELQSL